MAATQPSRHPSSALGWAGFAVAGGGLVACALGSERWEQAPGWAVALALVGLAEVGWALASLATQRALLPRPTVAALLATGAAWPVAIAQDVAPGAAGSVSPTSGALTSADVVLTVLHLVGAAGVAALARSRGGGRAARPKGAGRTVLAWAVPAVATAALVTPGLAATQAGALAQPHGVHGVPVHPPGPGTPEVGTPEVGPMPARPHAGH